MTHSHSYIKKNKHTLITYALSYNNIRRHDSVPTATIAGFTTVQTYISKIISQAPP